jgi:hypothetical protein
MKFEFQIAGMWRVGVGLLATAAAGLCAPDGAAIYAMHCANCHGDHGQGVPDEVAEPLHGNRSIPSLERYISRRMPEEDPSLVVGEDAAAVAAFIHGAFYSPASRAEAEVPPRAFARLTNRQFRESVADLLGSFGKPLPPGEGRGLSGEYFESDGMNKKARKLLGREDLALDFDFGAGPPVQGANPEQYSIAWDGSLLAEATGWHEFRLRTPNGARLYLNGERQDGDGNRRDDSGARRQAALIDEWVSSGNEVRQTTARVYLLGGRSYPIRLDYFKYKEARGMVRLEWKPPFGEWAVLSAPWISPSPARHVAVISTAFPPDDASEGYERGTGISKAWHEAVTAAAVEAANQVVARLPQLSGANEQAPDRVERLKRFCTTLAGRAFRRPLSDELAGQIVDSAFQPGVAPEDAVKRAVIRILCSPRFLYPELGPQVDDFTVASRLALGMWDSLPDKELLAAAAKGHLRTPDQIRAQAERMLPDPRTKAKLDAFFQRWLKLDVEGELRKSPEHFPGFDAALVADLRHSLDLFIDHVVWDRESADFRELIVSDELFLNRRLADYYGHSVPADGGFQRVKLDPAKSAGVLTHPYLLSRLAHYDVTSPIHRGVFLTRNILGGVLRPPPEAIAFDPGSFDPKMSTREKVAEMTKDSSCMSCHDTINPLGFSLENFDASGRFRLVENERPIHAESAFLTQEGVQLHLRGPRDVAGHAARSEFARRGFIRQMFQTLVQQPPAAYGAGTLARLDQDFVRSGHHIRRLLVEMNTLAARHGLPDPEQASR